MAMTDARLAEIEAYARAMCTGKPSVLAEDMVPDLLAEVRRLKRENRLLSLSRGVPDTLGMH